jgi:hypothetical protein
MSGQVRHDLRHVRHSAGILFGVSRHVSFRLDEAEHDAWTAQAREQGLSLTAFIKTRVNDGSAGLTDTVRRLVEAQAERVEWRLIETLRREAQGVTSSLLDERIEEHLRGQAHGFDPEAFEYRLRQLEEAIRRINQTIQSADFGASGASSDDGAGFSREVYID